MTFATILTIAAALSPFTFGAHNAAGRYDVEALRAAGCEFKGNAAHCTDEATVAGNWAFVTYDIVDRRLARLQVSGDRDALADLIPALIARYGEPCANGKETLTTGTGVQLSSETTTWCFATGKLTLHHRYANLHSYSMVYEDEITRVVQPQPRVDF